MCRCTGCRSTRRQTLVLIWTVTFTQALTTIQAQTLTQTEVTLTLTYITFQVHWLSEHAAANLLLDEVEAESDRVWNFIIAREIETPDRFRAIQSYRCDPVALSLTKPSPNPIWCKCNVHGQPYELH